MCAAIGARKEEVENLIRREYPRDLENNLEYATTIYDLGYPLVGGRFKLEKGETGKVLLSGNEAIALGAAAGGLDVYIAYPMTPSTSILHYFAAHDRDLGVVVVHPENELAVVNMAIGAVFAGARAMVGSSGVDWGPMRP